MPSTLAGFTLLELLIVLAVLSLLLAILIPNLLKARETANDAAAASLARNSINASEIIKSNNNGVPLYTAVTDCTPLLFPTLNSSILSCQFRQDDTISYSLVQASTHHYFYFDGQRLQGPLAAAPATW